MFSIKISLNQRTVKSSWGGSVAHRSTGQDETLQSE